MASHEAEIRPGLTAKFSLNPDQNGRPVLTKLTLEGDAILAEDLRRVSVRALEQVEAGQVVEPSRPLARPAGSDPVSHSALVAEHYRWHASRVSNPAMHMAAEAGVPVPTVHSWIRDARLRGLLPAAHRGKASSGGV